MAEEVGTRFPTDPCNPYPSPTIHCSSGVHAGRRTRATRCWARKPAHPPRMRALPSPVAALERMLALIGRAPARSPARLPPGKRFGSSHLPARPPVLLCISSCPACLFCNSPSRRFGHLPYFALLRRSCHAASAALACLLCGDGLALLRPSPSPCIAAPPWSTKDSSTATPTTGSTSACCRACNTSCLPAPAAAPARPPDPSTSSSPGEARPAGTRWAAVLRPAQGSSPTAPAAHLGCLTLAACPPPLPSSWQALAGRRAGHAVRVRHQAALPLLAAARPRQV